MNNITDIINPIALMLIFPVAACIVLFAVKSKALNSVIMFVNSVVYLITSVVLCFVPCSFTSYFKTDSLNIIFILIQGVVYFGVSLYNINSLKKTEVSVKWHTYYSVSFLLFVFSMAGVALSTHAALLWVFVEATTLTSAPLIYFSRTKSSLEATWKYIFVCSIGIAIAFVGIVFLSIGLGEQSSLFFADLYKNSSLVSPLWMKFSFPFILIGFGTKAGLAPFHAWLPDAHSESPSAVSAMLSGVLLNMAFLGILRFYKLLEIAQYGVYARNLLLIMGFLSLFVSAIYIIRIKSYKRMLAYSSIENIGIAAIGIGVGGLGMFAAILHLIVHSLTKAAFFLTSGNILHDYKKKEISEITGLLKENNITGWLWILSFVAIVGLPPFPIFISEFLLVKAMFENGFVPLAIIFFLLTTVVIYGIGSSVFKMAFGEPEKSCSGNKYMSIFTYIPQLLLLIILIIIGMSITSFNYDLIKNAISYF